jgi:hypothetical protein
METRVLRRQARAEARIAWPQFAPLSEADRGGRQNLRVRRPELARELRRRLSCRTSSDGPGQAGGGGSRDRRGQRCALAPGSGPQANRARGSSR